MEVSGRGKFLLRETKEQATSTSTSGPTPKIGDCDTSEYHHESSLVEDVPKGKVLEKLSLGVNGLAAASKVQRCVSRNMSRFTSLSFGGKNSSPQARTGDGRGGALFCGCAALPAQP